MPNRNTLVLIGRAAFLAAVTLASAGITSCIGYLPGGIGQTSAGSVAPTPNARVRLHELLDSANGTYINRLLVDRDSIIERWRDNGKPVRVWIDSSSSIIGPQTRYPAAVRAAFTQWANTGIPVRFTYVSSARDADVRVRWTSHLDHKTGSTSWRTDRNGWLISGDITLATHISDGHILDERGMRAIALHEVGHAIGLSHSDDAHDIMAALVRVDDLSEADRETVKLLYTLGAGHV